MCSSRKACNRRCRSFTLSLNSKFTAGSLSARESRSPFLDEVCHAFLEVIGPQACQHFSLGALKRFRQRLEHRLVHLSLDHLQGARADVRGQIHRVFLHTLPENFVRVDLIHQPHSQCFRGIDHSCSKQQVQRVGVTHQAWQHPCHTVLGNQSPLGKRCAESNRIGCKTQIAVQSDHQSQTNHRAVDARNHRSSNRGEVRIFLPEICSRTLAAFTYGLHRLGPPCFVESLLRDRAQERHICASAKSAPPAR